MIRTVALSATLLATIGVAQPADAWLIGKPPAAVAYVGPGDFTSFTAWWGLRAYSAATAAAQANAADLRRASDNATCTAKVATDGTLDVAVSLSCNGGTQTVTAWIGASSAKVSKLYDQTGGNACGGASCDLVQATAGLQNTLLLNCNGSLPCLDSPGGGAGDMVLTSANTFTPAGTVVSMSAVANRTSGTQSSCYWVMPTNIGAGNNRNRIACQSAANWNIGGAGARIDYAISNGTWNAINGVENTDPATTVVNANGVESSATTPVASTTADFPKIQLTGAFATLTTQWAEAGFEDNNAWSGTTRTNLCHNQRVYWSTGGSC